jgi:PKD repeat protein
MATDWIRIRVDDDTPPVADAGSDVVVGQGTLVGFDGTGSSDDHVVSEWNWSFEGPDGPVFLAGPEPSFQFDQVGTYEVTLRVGDPSGNWGVDVVSVVVLDTTPPVPELVGAISVDMGQLFTLDASRSHDNVGIKTFEWTLFDEGRWKRFAGDRLQYAFDHPGSYTVDLNVTDEAGNRASQETVVTVRDSEPPVAVIFTDGEAHVGVPFVLDGTRSHDNVAISEGHWTLDLSDGPINISGLNTTFVFTEPGEYRLTLTVRDDGGNQDEWTVTVVVYASEPSVGRVSMSPFILLTAFLVIVIAGFVYLRRRG